MAKSNCIPLFPLDVVLFPAMSLPLHIFEERYKLMTRLCLSRGLEFGMVLASSNSVATVGCSAEIVQKIKDYPDGRLDILVEGRSVFRLTEVLDQKEYYEGVVEYLEDAASPVDAAKESRILELLQQYYGLLFGQPWVGDESSQPATLAYRMAARLPIELKERQTLLEMRSENERREFLHGWLVKFLPQLAERQRTRRRAGGNGKGRTH